MKYMHILGCKLVAFIIIVLSLCLQNCNNVSDNEAYLQNKRIEQELTELLEDAKKGKVKAQFKVGRKFYQLWKEGHLINDLYEAQRWLRQASDQNYQKAIHFLDTVKNETMIEQKEALLDVAYLTQYPNPVEGDIDTHCKLKKRKILDSSNNNELKEQKNISNRKEIKESKKTKNNMVRFGYTIFYVKDVSETISFYEKAFGFRRKFITPENEYGELITGETVLSFASISLASKNFSGSFIESKIENNPFGIEIAFTTNQVEEVYNNAINQGALSVEGIKTKPWGQTVAYVRDINGFLIEICTPIS